MTQILPYILPLMLGRTFDLNKMQVGVDIYPKDEIEKPVLIRTPYTDTRYKIIDNTIESRDLLDVEGGFSLKVKGDIFKAGASGAYLKDAYNRENTIEVTVKATYQMVTEQIPPKAKPITTWKSKGALGTHYVRSVIYGGELLASIRISTNNTRDKKRIKGALEIGGQIDIFDVGIKVEGEYMKDVTKNVEATDIKVFSSIPLSKIPNDMKTLKDVLETFPDDLKKYNEGRGVPIKVELWPLTHLDASRTSQLKNRALEANLDAFEKKFDDLLNTKSAIADWLKSTQEPLNENQEKQIGELYSTVQKAIRPFYQVIGDLDMSNGTEQLNPALDAYGNELSGAFYRKYLNVRQQIVSDQGEWSRGVGSGATYTHWGKKDCTSISDVIISGLAYTCGDGKKGSAIICLPPGSKPGPEQEDIQDNPLYELATFLDSSSSRVICSTCRLKRRSSVETFVGKNLCPPGWEYIYKGFLTSSLTSTFICLDRNIEKENCPASDNPIYNMWFSKLDVNSKEMRSLISCIVCAK